VLVRTLGAIGRSLITAGVLILLFVAYELWGTGIQEAHAQNKLRDELAEQLASTTTTSTTTTTTLPPGVTRPPGFSVVPTKVTPADIPLPKPGDPIAEINIKKIGLTRTVVEGVTLDQLKRGPGHYPTTPLPGQAGNAAIAGHRTTYGQPFHNLDKLENGDHIFIRTLQGSFVYAVDRIVIVKPSQSEVLLPTKKKDGTLENRITLTACHPKYSAAKRLIVSGILIGKPVAEYKGQSNAREKAIDDASNGKGDNPETIGLGLSGVPSSKTPAIVWGIVCALIWLATWLIQTALRRRAKRLAAEDPEGHGHPTRTQRLLTWTPYLVGVPVFLLALYVFFENFGRLLPANY
jgi:sortase A